jgi:hypothetical protein
VRAYTAHPARRVVTLLLPLAGAQRDTRSAALFAGFVTVLVASVSLAAGRTKP